MPDEYPLPEGLARLAKRKSFAPNELREACRSAGEMVEMWWGLDLPAWVAPYALRDARLGYLAGYGEALVSGELQGWRVDEAARARWGDGWQEKLATARERRARDE